MSIAKMIFGAGVNLQFDLDPGVEVWRVASERADGSQVTYKGGGYTLELQEEREESCTLVQFSLKRDNGELFTLHEYGVYTDGSAVDVDKVWLPWALSSWVEMVGLLRHYSSLTSVGWSIQGDSFKSSADRGLPLILALNREGTAKLAVGFLDQRIETDIQHSILTHYASGLQHRGTMRFKLRRPLDGYSLSGLTEHRDGFFVSRGMSWFDTIQTYREIHEEKTGREFRPSPDAAWEPVLAPWGATKGNWDWMREEYLGAKEMWPIAQQMAELGLRGFINWGSWFRDVLPHYKTVERLIWGFPDAIGDFVPSPDKFPDMPAFIKRLKSIGVMGMFWISPWLVGRRTKAREELKEALVELDMDPSHPQYNTLTSYLCPRNPITQKHVPELMARVMREYGNDGFTVDMVDSAPLQPCVADHEHNYDSVGLAMADTFAAIRRAVDEVNPNCVIEFRAKYSNISNMFNSTAHRSTDSGEAGSYDMNRRNCLITRSYMPPGVAVHTDPQWWHIEEKNETVAKMLSTMVVSGVPQIGADVINMTDDHRRLLKGWLAFYQEHKEDFRWGQMRPVQNDAQFSTIKVERGKKAFVSYASFPALRVPLSEEAEEIYLFNCTNEDSLFTILLNVAGDFAVTVHNYDLSPLSETALTAADGSLLVDLAVPQGGYIALRNTGQ